MSIHRVALIFDDRARPETTGVYCRRALERLVDVVHGWGPRAPAIWRSCATAVNSFSSTGSRATRSRRSRRPSTTIPPTLRLTTISERCSFGAAATTKPCKLTGSRSGSDPTAPGLISTSAVL